MALVFPSAPTPGQRIPIDPGTSGVSQYAWNNTKGVWNTVDTTVSLGVANQGAFNQYQWPLTDGLAGKQLTTDGAGNLSWELEANNNIQALGINPLTDGVNQDFWLVQLGTLTPYVPTPSTNIIVFLGGVPQVPGTAYTVNVDQISFTAPPPAGTTFYAISNTVVV